MHIFGRNPNCGTTEEDVWSDGGAYNWLTAADELEVISDDADDTAAGSGAQSVTVDCLLADFTRASETVATAGLSASSLTSIQCVRLLDAYVNQVGAYTGANEGNVSIRTEAGTVLGDMLTGFGQTELSMYTIPAGHTGYLMRVDVGVDSSKTATVELFERLNADDVTTPFSPKRLIWDFDGVSGQVSEKLESPLVLPAKTDIWWSCIGPSGGAPVDVAYDIWLVPQ